MKNRFIFAVSTMTAFMIFHLTAHADNHAHRLGTDGCPVCFSEEGDDTCDNPDSSLDSKICNQIGFHHYEEGDYDAAIICFKRAISLSPNYQIPYNNLGVTYLKTHRLELAKECFKNAIAVDPAYVKAICNLAVVSYKQGDLKSAENLFWQARRIDESYVRLRMDTYLGNHLHPGSDTEPFLH